MNKKFTRSGLAAAIALLVSAGASADDGISPNAMAQIKSVMAAKASLTPAQKKMSSDLAYGLMAAANDSRVASFTNTLTPLNVSDVNGNPTTVTSSSDLASTFVTVEIAGDAEGIAGAVTAAGGTVILKATPFGLVDASLPLSAVGAVAESAAVKQIRTPSPASTNVGALTSQGFATHEANKVVNTLGYNGTGIKVGVLSDSATAAQITALKASGDLKSTATALAGQNGTGTNEGAAMMEIIQDMAPGADLIFATANPSQAQFATNILNLAAAGCTVIVDDVSYFAEGVFQDGTVARAVNMVTAGGVIYFSSSANSGSLTKGTSGTWEGDYKDGGPLTSGPVFAAGETGRLHDFSPTSTPQLYDVLTAQTTFISLKWSDPLGGSTNDYDLFVLSADGNTLLKASGSVQSGTQDPYEAVSQANNAASPGGFPIGARIVVVAYSNVANGVPAPAPRAFHVDTSRGMLSIATTGSTYGHNAAANTMTTAATYWNSNKAGAKPFTSTSTNETFSSDGPRRIFYTPTGTPITPNNFLFATNGGTLLQKPDIAAADGVSTKTPNFNPFFGTSAAAPHAAGIAALVRQARPTYTVDQVKTAIRASAIDSMGPGTDRDSGYGIAMGLAAVNYALGH